MDVRRWFILSIALLTLNTVVSASGVLFVKPATTTSCPQQPCHTLQHYAQRWQFYLTSNTVVQFLPGEHVLEGDWNELLVDSVSNLTLIGSVSVITDRLPLGVPTATSRISCTGGKSFFVFFNVTELFIARLVFSECGGGKPKLKLSTTLIFYKMNFTLLLCEVSNLVLDTVTIQNSTGTGLWGYNIRGESLIHRSTFLFNAAAALPCAGNIMLLYKNSSENSQVNITSSWIMFGDADPTKYPCVGGLILNLNQSSYSVEVHIHNTTMKRNVGGNMFLALDNSGQKHITISDSHFEGGYTLYGGGGIGMSSHIMTDYNASGSVHVNITNSNFMGNYAQLDGGAVMIVTGSSPYGSTKVYIHGSNFHSNKAQRYGGHIVLSLLHSDSPFQGNISITVDNSHFEDGTAFAGGGLAVWSNYKALQCVQSDHVDITNTEFVGNHADEDGGAVLVAPSSSLCTGTEVYINGTKFHNNTANRYGGHILIFLKSHPIKNNLSLVVNNSHFEDGKAHFGGGVIAWVQESRQVSHPTPVCAHLQPQIHWFVYILNSKFYRNVADIGGGMAVQFNHSCFTTHVVIDNVSLSRNTAINNTGGNIHILVQPCTGGNSVTVSRSIVELGNSSESGGGMTFLGGNACLFPTVRDRPTTINIVDSTFRYNTAYKVGGGGLRIIFQSFQHSCCSAEVNILNVTFLNNTAHIVTTIDIAKPLLTYRFGGGNIFITDDGGQWRNNTVRIENSLIEGGVAPYGGGIYLLQRAIPTGSWSPPPEISRVETLHISNTQFVGNRVIITDGITNGLGGASLTVEIVSRDLVYPTIPTMIKTFTITDTTFEGTGVDSSTIEFWGPFSPLFLLKYNVVFTNVSFQEHENLLLYRLQPTVLLTVVSNATFIDCEFTGSGDSAINALNTNMFFEGNITFRNSIAAKGGGLALLEDAIMYLRPNTHILFSHNHVIYVGGAIYIEPQHVNKCFFEIADESIFDPAEPNILIEFENNTADFAGSALYGGDVEFCRVYGYFDSIFKIQNTDNDPSAISSNPHKVCICNGSKPQCDYQYRVHPWAVHTYPGALFQIQAVIVGQEDGIVSGDVHAVSTFENMSVHLGDLQEFQSTGKSCTKVNYQVFSTDTVEYITLVPSNIHGRLRLEAPQMKVTLLPCPQGFRLSEIPPTKCDCVEELNNHHITTCNITDQTITRPPQLWIGYYQPGNDSALQVEGVLVHDDCPFDYCKLEELLIHLNDSDKQCAFNRSGVLCGGCQPGLSLALGTSRCLECSNRHLGLLLAFAVAGLALVFLLTLTNMTISEGAINGLIFYANIIHINRAIFFPTESTGIPRTVLDVLSTFIAWINLDLGIETCFYNGMDMYSKAWLQFLFPIYIWTIVGGMIVSSHYSTTAAKLFRRHAVKVLATLFLLSFAKIQRSIITALSFTFLTYPDGTTKTLWLYDSNIEYLHGKHVPLFLAALLVLLLLLIPYTLVLLLIQCLSKPNHRILFWVRKLKPLLDAYTGPYKDRYRFWTGLLLVIRTILFLIFTLGNPALNLAAIILASLCLAFMPGVYKKAPLTLLEYSFFLNLSAVSVGTFYSRYTQFSSNQAVLVCVSAGTALLTFSGILVYHLYHCVTTSQAWKSVSGRFAQRRFPLNDRELVNVAAEGSDEEEDPARAEIRPLILQFDEYREPVLAYEDGD